MSDTKTCDLCGRSEIVMRSDREQFGTISFPTPAISRGTSDQELRKLRLEYDGSFIDFCRGCATPLKDFVRDAVKSAERAIPKRPKYKQKRKIRRA